MAWFLGAALGVASMAAVAGNQVQGGWGKAHSGEGTYYQYTGGGNCSFPPPTGKTVAMNTTDYDGSKACGGCVQITNPANGKKVEARIDDRCPTCAPGDVDMDEEVFASIAELWQGRIPIQWKYVACPPPAMTIFFEDGSSQWWTSLQVRDHRYPVAKLAWRPSGSTAKYTVSTRELHNVFVPAGGMGAGPYDLKITDVYGQVVKINGVPLSPGQVVQTGKQFPIRTGAMRTGSVLQDALAVSAAVDQASDDDRDDDAAQ